MEKFQVVKRKKVWFDFFFKFIEIFKILFCFILIEISGHCFITLIIIIIVTIITIIAVIIIITLIIVFYYYYYFYIQETTSQKMV